MSYNNNIIFNKYLENIGKFIEKNNNKKELFNNLNIDEKMQMINNNDILFYFLLFIVVFIFFNNFEIKINQIFSIIICYLLFTYLLNYNLNNKKTFYYNKKNEIDYLNEYLYSNNKNIENYNGINNINKINVSYFYLDPYLTNFLFNLRDFVSYNPQNYGRLLLHCNNILEIKKDVNIGIKNPWANFETANLEKKKALNNLQSIIYNVPNYNQYNKKINKSLDILHQILNKYLNDILNICNINIKKNNYNIHSTPTNLLKSNYLINPNDNKDNYHEFFNQ